MKRLKKFKSPFHEHLDIAGSPTNTGFNFAHKWKLIVLFTTIMALSPLFVMTLVEFSLTRRTMEDEMKKNILNSLNTAVASISFSKDLEKSIRDYIRNLDPGEDNDIFLVNELGTLLTTSFHYGKSGSPNVLDSVLFKENSGIIEDVVSNGEQVFAGYFEIPNSSSLLVLVKSKKNLTDLWLKPRLKLIWYLIVSIILILLSIMGMATYLVGRIHSADKKRMDARHAEYSYRVASIGRLSSSVAHEINNPLAIINEKTGLILDLLSLKEGYVSKDRLTPLAKDILDAMDRCSKITRRLLDFARHMEPSIQSVDIKEVVGRVLAFFENEAEQRNITISVESRDTIPGFECDRGSLLQIFVNLFNNAFAAMKDGGQLSISIKFDKNKKITIIVSDSGKGIAKDDINKIFEPFYTSENDNLGTGLGLAITYGLIKELGGDITVESKIDEGTRFTLMLPLKPQTGQDMNTPSHVV